MRDCVPVKWGSLRTRNVLSQIYNVEKKALTINFGGPTIRQDLDNFTITIRVTLPVWVVFFLFSSDPFRRVDNLIDWEVYRWVPRIVLGHSHSAG